MFYVCQSLVDATTGKVLKELYNKEPITHSHSHTDTGGKLGEVSSPRAQRQYAHPGAGIRTTTFPIIRPFSQGSRLQMHEEVTRIMLLKQSYVAFWL